MAQIFGNAVLTDAGAALIAACEADDAVLTFTRVVTGDGEHSDKSVAALKVRTALISQKQSFSISSKRQSAAVAKITAVLSNRYLNTGYYMNELGLYAQKGSDSTTEVLFSISVVVAAQGDWFPPYNGVSPAEVVQSFAITSCNDVTVQIALETDSYALKSELGDLDDLTTTDKDNVVEAINEIKDEVRPISKGGTGKNNADDACDNLGAVRRSIYANVHDESPLDDDVYGGDYIIHDGRMYFASQGKIPAGSTLNPYPGVGKNCDSVFADQELSEKASYTAITKNWEREFKCAISSSGYDVDDLVYIWCAKKIYKVTATIAYGESMVVNTNIKEWSVEDETSSISSQLTSITAAMNTCFDEALDTSAGWKYKTLSSSLRKFVTLRAYVSGSTTLYITTMPKAVFDMFGSANPLRLLGTQDSDSLYVASSSGSQFRTYNATGISNLKLAVYTQD